jgi:hypothetical protein
LVGDVIPPKVMGKYVVKVEGRATTRYVWIALDSNEIVEDKVALKAVRKDG